MSDTFDQPVAMDQPATMDPLGMMEQLMPAAIALIERTMEMWPASAIISTSHTTWTYFTSTQAATVGSNILFLVPVAVVLIGLVGLFVTARGVLLVGCFAFAFAAMADWVYSWGYLYYHLLGFSSVLVSLAALHVYMVGGDITSEIIWLYRALDYIGFDGGMHQYYSTRLENRQRERRARRYREMPVPPTPSPEEVAERAAKFRRLQDRCERARILAFPAAVEGEGAQNNNAAVVLARPPVNANSISEPDFEPENIEGRNAGQRDLDMRSARYLLQWLARETQESEGFVVPVKWSQSKRTGEIECYNGYAQANRPTPEDFFANSDTLVIGSVSVMQPDEIQPALQLIQTALDYVKFYDTSAFRTVEREIGNLQSHSQFRRAVAVNCEFKRYPPEFRNDSSLNFDVDNPRWVEDQSGKKDRFVEKDRELINLLTVSVDRYLVVTFHIGYMLQHPTAETCTELSVLFGDFVLNKRVLKILHNVPNTVAALDATLEHIFRGRRPGGTGGAGYTAALGQYNRSTRKPFRDTPEGPLRTPHYKDTGPDTFLNANRPIATEFGRGERPCPIGLHGPGMDYAGRHCPCSLGILDVTSVLDFILRQHRFIPGDPEIAPRRGEILWPVLASWAEPREGCKFERLSQWMLAGSKYQPLLCRFRTGGFTEPIHPDVTGLEPAAVARAANIYKMRSALYNEGVAQLYTAFGETHGVEVNDECLSYIVGDVIGLGLMFRYLLTVESPRLTAERLCHYGYREILRVEPFAYETALYRPPLAPLAQEPFVTPNAHTIGLEVDVQPEQYVREYVVDEIYGELASRPWWYMRRDTHWRALENYGRVISSRFDRTGWQHPAPPEAPPPAPIADGNNNLPLRCRNLAAQIFRNNAANVPPNLVTFLLRARNFSNGTWFWAFACLFEWHCGLASLMLPAEDLAVIYNDARPVPAEVTFRREFAAFVRTTGTRARLQPGAAGRRPGALPPPPAALILPPSPPRIEVPDDPAPTVSPPRQPRWGIFGWRAGPEVPIDPEPVDPAEGGWWRNLLGGAAAPVVPEPEDPGPPEGYIVRRSRVTGRLYWFNAQRGESMWPNTAAALAAERRAVDANERARVAATAAGEERTTAENSATAAEASAATAATHVTTAQQQNAPAANILRANNAAAAARTAADAAAQRAVNARDAVTRIAQFADSADAAFRTGRADVAVESARRAAEIVAAAGVASAAAVQHAAEAAAAAQEAFGAAAPAYATLAAAARQLADRNRRALNDFPPTQALFDEFLIREMDIAIGAQAAADPAPLAGPVPPPLITASLADVRRMRELARDAQALADAAIARSAEVALEEAAGEEEIAAAAAADVAARQTATTAWDALTATAIAAGIMNPNFAIDVPPAGPEEAVRSAAILAARAVFQDALDRAIEISTNHPARLEGLGEDDRESVARAQGAQMRSDQANAAAAALAPEPVPVPGVEPVPAPVPVPAPEPAVDVSTLIAVPVPAQHDFMDGVCSEILIFMLVQEISQYEALDEGRRRFFGFAQMEDEYLDFAGTPLWDHPAVRLMTEQAGLRLVDDGAYSRFSYTEPYWFKRLQVLLGHDFACCVPLNSPDTTICRECGARDRYDLLEMLIAELERVRRLAGVQVRLKDAYERIYRDARRGLWIGARFQKPRAPTPPSTFLVETVPDPGLATRFLWTPLQDFLGGVVLAGLWAGAAPLLREMVVRTVVGLRILWTPIELANTLRAVAYRIYFTAALTIVNLLAPGDLIAPVFTAERNRRVVLGLWIVPQATLGICILYYGLENPFEGESTLAGLWTPMLNIVGLWLAIPSISPIIEGAFPDQWARGEAALAGMWAGILARLEALVAAPAVVVREPEQPAVVPAPPRTQYGTEWTVPVWCRCLLRAPVSIEPGFPRPSARRLHRDWLQATILLLHLNPETGPNTWDCLAKWWKQGVRVQAVAFADENVQHFEFPALTQITDDNPLALPAFGINAEAVAARRSHGPTMRQRVAVAHQSDHELALAAARARAEVRRGERAARGRGRGRGGGPGGGPPGGGGGGGPPGGGPPVGEPGGGPGGGLPGGGPGGDPPGGGGGGPGGGGPPGGGGGGGPPGEGPGGGPGGDPPGGGGGGGPPAGGPPGGGGGPGGGPGGPPGGGPGGGPEAPPGGAPPIGALLVGGPAGGPAGGPVQGPIGALPVGGPVQGPIGAPPAGGPAVAPPAGGPAEGPVGGPAGGPAGGPVQGPAVAPPVGEPAGGPVQEPAVAPPVGGPAGGPAVVPPAQGPAAEPVQGPAEAPPAADPPAIDPPGALRAPRAPRRGPPDARGGRRQQRYRGPIAGFDDGGLFTGVGRVPGLFGVGGDGRVGAVGLVGGDDRGRGRGAAAARARGRAGRGGRSP